MLVFVLSSICLGVGVLPKKQTQIYAASTKVILGSSGKKAEYSALFKGDETTSDDDVIFSVEKVLISNEHDADGVPNALTGTDVLKMYGGAKSNGEDREYTYKNIEKGSQNKTVIDNGDFAVLENIIDSNGNIAKVKGSDEQQAIMVSFGAYVYTPEKILDENIVTSEKVEIASKDNAGKNTIYETISYLDVSLTKDGVLQTAGFLPDKRNITVDSGPYFDFVYVIEQNADSSNEGHYQFNIEYSIDSRIFNAEFEFYIVNSASYNRTNNPSGKDYGYEAQPTLGWLEVGKDDYTKKPQNKNDWVTYSIGVQGVDEEIVSYPTITYDYTKYKLTYKHIANQKNIVHKFECEYLYGLGPTRAQLKHSITSNGETTIAEPVVLNDFKLDSAINLVTIILTEPGSYTVDYEYIYSGYKAEVAPELDIEKEPINLLVSGLQPNYSKIGYEGARLQYFNIATKNNNSLDIFIPNGYDLENSDISSLKDKDLGFAYSFVEKDDNYREGTLVLEGSKNALINASLSNNKTTDSGSDYDFLKNNITAITSNTMGDAFKEDLDKVLGRITYVDTNQGSLWLAGNDKYSNESFYFYALTPIKSNNILNADLLNSKKAFNNTTSFNSKGYYLVFVKVLPQKGEEFWQIFAMQYTSSSVDINIEAIMDDKGTLDTSDDIVEIVEGGKYTNKDVRISWKKPGIFDRAINPFYHQALNNNLSREQLLNLAKFNFDSISLVERDKELYYSVGLGKNVAKGTFVKYLIRLESEGGGATYKIFTIDRQDISGVQPFLIEEKFSGSSKFYSFATDKNNYIIPINNSITDSYATIMWNDKASGAEIYASYNYTPFVQKVNDSSEITGNGSETWMTTNYELGTTIEGSSLNRASSKFNVGTDCILFNQGIYIMKIWDAAGNLCYYAFVIDRTENYFKIHNEVITNTSVIHGDNVNYSVGDYKVFELKTDNEELNDFISKASSNKLASFKDDLYYKGDYNNINIIKNYFKKQSDSYYLTVRNIRVIGDDTQFRQDPSISNIKGELVFSVSGEGYYKRTLYVNSENKLYSTQSIRDGSFVIVEINKDNARGMAYYSDDEIDSVPADGVSTDSVIRYDMVGSDTIDDNGVETSGMVGARATSAKHIAFVWNMGKGSGNFEVSNVYYSFYSLKSDYNDDKYYFYGSPEENVPIYTEGVWGSNAEELGDGRGLVVFNGRNDTNAGLYVVTREYKYNESADLGDDIRVRNYYFIVDRNEVINLVQGVGENIKLWLLEQEEDFNTFTTGGTNYEILNSSEDKIENQRYNIYLTTTKVPATIQIPKGKYFIDENKTSDKYFAGQLNVKIYFNDLESQLPDQYRSANGVKIFDSIVDKGVNGYEYAKVENGYYVIDIYKYLTDVNVLLRDRVTESRDNKNWLFLSGDYIIKITDNSVSTKGDYHTKYIGFRIAGTTDLGPQVNSFTGYNKNDTNKIIVNTDKKFNYSATVSQEFLKVEIPPYQSGIVEKAQVDPNYMVVKQFYGENANGTNYVNYQYKHIGGYNYKDYGNGIVEVKDGIVNLWLDTKLRKNGVVDVEGLSIPLYYTITVRYKIGDGETHDKYQNCYVYYDAAGNKNYYFEATYKISIDREAPKENIEALIKSDALVEDYNSMYGSKTIVENNFHETSSNLYFTKQYSKYYETINDNKDESFIYVFQVFEEERSGENVIVEATPFVVNDVAKIYHREISGAINGGNGFDLKLPLIDESKYTQINNIDINTYQGLGLTPNRYYEIIEQDKAGNTTQYVIHYQPQPDITSIVLPVTLTQTDGQVVESEIGFENFDDKLSINEDVKQFNIYDLVATRDSTAANENFFKIEVSQASGEVVLTLLTTATTRFEKINQQIVDKLKEEHFGNFTIKVTTRKAKNVTSSNNTYTQVIRINLYDKSDVKSVNINDLVYDSNGELYRNESGQVYINLRGGNIHDTEKDLWYFATEIIIKTGTESVTYKGYISQGEVEYVNTTTGEVDPDRIVECEEDTIYYIIMKDVLGTPKQLRFSTTGKYFYKVMFENSAQAGDYGNYYYEGYEGTNNVYYGFTNAKVEYDAIFSAEVEVKINGEYSSEVLNARQNPETGYYEIFINANHPSKITDVGSIVEKRIIIRDGTSIEQTYYITIDTRLSNVALRDYNSGEQRQQIISVFPNTPYTDESARSNTAGSGIMNLMWEKPAENSYFDYKYTLYELMKDGNYRADANGNIGTDLTNKTAYVISTGTDSKGIYKFEISVYGKDGKLLGNRLFSFEVQEISSQIYYLRNNKGEAIPANSSFVKADVMHLNLNATDFVSVNDNIFFPLYITNEELSVVVTAVDVEAEETLVTNPISHPNSLYEFRIVKIHKQNSFALYLGILRVRETETLLTNTVTIGDKEVTDITSFTLAGTADSVFTISSNVQNVINDRLLQKNELNIAVYYNEEYVKTEKFTGNYSIAGNGEYVFEFVDLAGNVHKFANGNTRLEVYVLREVVVLINDEAPINNAFYNDEVSLVIYASVRYVTGSIDMVAERNGVRYYPEGSNPYIFKDYGTYRIEISALYNDGGLEPIQLKKIITFTIVNVKEARRSIDLTSLKGSEITKVTNTYGEDKTKEFLAILQEYDGGMNISYEKLIDYADILNITAGKITFTITYKVDGYEEDYPDRIVDFSFTLNNETPVIECSLEKGETTTKKFSIYFNAAILYEQIGEAYIYINDTLVAHIDENSENKEVEIVTSFKQQGAGDYYVKLVSTSGVVWDSYKVTIKEPLNFWAIVVIIAVVAVILTVVISIVVLRRKMRIR